MANPSLRRPAEQQTLKQEAADKAKSTDDPDRSVDQVITEGIEGSDEPIGEHHPAALFAIIFGAYPIFLILALALALAFIAWWART